jgi:hypothetical protein
MEDSMSNTAWVATRKGLAEVQRAGGTWTVKAMHHRGKPISMMLAQPGALYAATNEGHFGAHLHVSTDRGKTWSEIAMPAFEPTGDAEKKGPSVSEIWALEGGGRPGVLWAGTKPGGLFRSDDGGKIWSLNEPLWTAPGRDKWFGGGTEEPVIHSIAVDPKNPMRVTIAVSCGGVWRSQDDGKSWQVHGKGMRASYMPPDQAENPVVQDPHRLVQSAADPKTYWVQHHNGIFRSTNDLDSWREISKAGPSTFGFAVATHPHDPQTAWFAPAQKDEARYPVDGKFVVTKTSDGGESFRIIDRGLPNTISYDLVYRHGLDVDATGERLVMGSTTGNLWISEDSGNSWDHVSGHLPPIYAVRFG